MEELIRYLKERKIIKTKKVEDAFRNIPFINFVPKNQIERFLFDSPVMFPTLGRNISAPHMNAIMLELLDLDFDDNLLIIGSKLGYLASLASQIITDGNIVIIDANSLVVAQTIRNLERINLQERIYVANGQPLEGDVENSPWDRIIVTASIREISLDLLAQLKVGGSIFAPVGDMRKQELVQQFRQNVSLKKSDFLQKSWGSVVFGPLDINLDTSEVYDGDLLDENEFAKEYDEKLKTTENLTFFCPHCQFEFFQLPLSLKTPSKKISVNYKIQCPQCKKVFSLIAKLKDDDSLELSIE
jgi:protein-L-isoaspartate(D-aspartate) O-methyltransferase